MKTHRLRLGPAVPKDEHGAEFPVAYIESDQLSSSIHSNDTRGFYYCGEPQAVPSNPATEFNNDSPLSSPVINPSICGSTDLPTSAGEIKFLPAQINNIGKLKT